jgi:tRNA pseudouridine38-40 synthase
MRVALGVAYGGGNYQGWQSQAGGQTVQDVLETALTQFATQQIHVLCAGRTDAGVHGLMQVVHFDTEVHRPCAAWVRGTNAFLPPDVSVQWAQLVPSSFHARGSALTRRYAYVLLQSAVRPSVELGRVGWVFRTLNHQAMQEAADYLAGEHDFTSFRAAACQALSPVKTLHPIRITRRSHSDDSQTCYWRFEFEGNAFLHHMIRNIMGSLIAIGRGNYPPQWMQQILEAKSRKVAAPTFAPDGLYFLGPTYDSHWGLPTRTAAYDWLP